MKRLTFFLFTAAVLIFSHPFLQAEEQILSVVASKEFSVAIDDLPHALVETWKERELQLTSEYDALRSEIQESYREEVDDLAEDLKEATEELHLEFQDSFDELREGFRQSQQEISREEDPEEREDALADLEEEYYGQRSLLEEDLQEGIDDLRREFDEEVLDLTKEKDLELLEIEKEQRQATQTLEKEILQTFLDRKSEELKVEVLRKILVLKNITLIGDHLIENLIEFMGTQVEIKIEQNRVSRSRVALNVEGRIESGALDEILKKIGWLVPPASVTIHFRRWKELEMIRNLIREVGCLTEGYRLNTQDDIYVLDGFSYLPLPGLKERFNSVTIGEGEARAEIEGDLLIVTPFP